MSTIGINTSCAIQAVYATARINKQPDLWDRSLGGGGEIRQEIGTERASEPVSYRETPHCQYVCHSSVTCDRSIAAAIKILCVQQ